MTDYVMTGLCKRRAELTGEISATHEKQKTLVNDLEHLDKTIHQFDPEFVIESIKPKAFRPPSDWAQRGEMTRICLSILRKAAVPMTSRDIAVELLMERALDKEDQRLIRLMTKRVGVALRKQREDGIVKSDTAAGMWQTWEVCR